MHTTAAPIARLGLLTTVLALVLMMAPAVSGQNQKEVFTGFAIDMNTGPRTATVDIMIEGWSTDAEREALWPS